MRPRHLIGFALAGLFVWSVPSLPADPIVTPEIDRTAVELRKRALETTRAYELVRSLLVEVGPRFAGSPGDRAAVAWAARTMKELGLRNVRTEPVEVPRWIRGREHGAIVAPYPQEVVLTALGGSSSTPDGGLEAEVVLVEDVAALDRRSDEEVTGKIVFLNQRTPRTQDGAGYGLAGPIRWFGPARAAAKGAVATIIRSVGTGGHRFPHTGSSRPSDEGVPPFVAAALAVPDADVLEAQFESGKPVRFRLELGAHIDGSATSANVIGEIPGRERPEEIVLLGAHLDSWDITPGANDDASGCAITLEAARLIGTLPQAPRRTVRVVLFANEEFGLSGAKAYAERYADAIDRHVLAMEADLGAGAVWRMRARTDDASQAIVEAWAARLAPLGVTWSDVTAFGGVDLSPLRPLGVPMINLDPDASRYFDLHHTLDDTLDKIDREAIAQNVAAYTVIAWFAAESETTLGRPD